MYTETILSPNGFSWSHFYIIIYQFVTKTMRSVTANIVDLGNKGRAQDQAHTRWVQCFTVLIK